jgi:hypothetical protein
VTLMPRPPEPGRQAGAGQPLGAKTLSCLDDSLKKRKIGRKRQRKIGRRSSAAGHLTSPQAARANAFLTVMASPSTTVWGVGGLNAVGVQCFRDGAKRRYARLLVRLDNRQTFAA